jgi:hypothetical protein
MRWVVLPLVLFVGSPIGKWQSTIEQNPSPAVSQGKKESDMSDYEPIPLDRVIGMAQLIVVGEVSKVKEGSFTLRPTQTLAGAASAGEIEVLQFTPNRFEGAPRTAPYKTGQTFLLFLIHDEKHPTEGAWRILGIGGEGEMPVEDGFVYFHGRNVEGLPFGSYTVHGAVRKIQRFDAQKFFDAVKGYRLCFAWKPDKENRLEPTRLCDETSLERYASASDIHRHLARLTSRRLDDR